MRGPLACPCVQGRRSDEHVLTRCDVHRGRGDVRCQLCKAKGYFCEFCRSKEIIYPFDFATTVRCNDCRSLAHKKCYNRATCPKCARIARVAKQASERTPI